MGDQKDIKERLSQLLLECHDLLPKIQINYK